MECADPEGGRGSGPPLENHKAIGFFSNTGLVPKNHHKATKQAFNTRPSSARLQNRIERAICWPVDKGTILVIFGSFLLSSIKIQKKKNIVRFGPPLAKLSGSTDVWVIEKPISVTKHSGIWLLIQKGLIKK